MRSALITRATYSKSHRFQLYHGKTYSESTYWTRKNNVFHTPSKNYIQIYFGSGDQSFVGWVHPLPSPPRCPPRDPSQLLTSWKYLTCLHRWSKECQQGGTNTVLNSKFPLVASNVATHGGGYFYRGGSSKRRNLRLLLRSTWAGRVLSCNVTFRPARRRRWWGWWRPATRSRRGWSRGSCGPPLSTKLSRTEGPTDSRGSFMFNFLCSWSEIN